MRKSKKGETSQTCFLVREKIKDKLKRGVVVSKNKKPRVLNQVNAKFYQAFSRSVKIKLLTKFEGIVHSLSSGKVEMFLCAACHAFPPHVNAWKR